MKNSLLQQLETIAADPLYRSPMGICGVATRAGHDEDYLEPFFASWPEYSGDPVFPVPYGEYMKASAYERWSPNHVYGAARRRLLAHIIVLLKA